MPSQHLSHDVETQRMDVLPAVAAEVKRDDIRASLDRVGYALDQVRLVFCTHFLNRMVYEHVGPGCHCPQHAGHQGHMARIGTDAGRAAADRILLLPIDATQPVVLRRRLRQPAAVQDGHQDTFASAWLFGHVRVGRRVGRNLLRLGGGTGAVDADVEDVVGRGHPLAERHVHGGADVLYVPGFLIGERQAGQAAQVVVVLNRHAWHDSSYAIDVLVTNKKGSLSIEVVNLTALCPIRRPGCRALQGVHDTGNAMQDQPDLRLETATRPAALLVTSRHARPDIAWDG